MTRYCVVTQAHECTAALWRQRPLSVPHARAQTPPPSPPPKHTHTTPNSYGAHVPADASSIARYQAGLARCFKAALDAGFTTLHLLPHVDPFEVKNGARRGLWRNVVRFAPAAK